MIDSPDEELMLEVRSGTATSLGVIFDRYHGPLFNFYCKSTGDRAASEDLVQEVFCRILKYRHTYRPGTPFRTWMYQIARNARFDRIKKQASEAKLEAQTSVADPPQAVLERKQDGALLHRALMRLPDEKREVLVLSRFQELSYPEIAELLQCEVGAVKVRVFRALRELGDIFRQLEQQAVLPAKNSHPICGAES
jgi:RNA polymerase sigma-70 factor (ECF subfamily)